MAMKILLADDSMTAQNMGKKILTDAGFEVIAVSNGAAALKKITAENPDIIILDVFMPGYTGLEVCERLKNNPETSRKPVLLTVGKMEPFNPDDSNRVRAEGVMIKPFEATDLTAAIEAIAKRFNIPRTTAAPPPPPPPPPKAPQNLRSYEETVMLSQDELRQSMGIVDEGTQTTAVASAASAATPASSGAVAVAAPPLELDSSAIVTEQQEETKPVEAVPAMEFDPPSRATESEHSPFSHASVAREVVEHPAAPVQASETADWDPVLDGIAISSNVITTAPEAAQATDEAQPMFGLEYAVPASVAQEAPAAAAEEPATEPTMYSSPVQSAEEEPEISSPSAYLAEASAAMGLETSHALVEDTPVVESAPDFEPNVAPPVQVETQAENGVEPGIEQPSPELTVPPDPALVGGTDSFSDFTTRFGVENAEVIPVGIVPELMDDASSSYEYQPPEEGHAFEGNGQPEASAEEAKSEDAPEALTPVAVSSTATTSWEMVPVEAEANAPTAATPEVAETPEVPTVTESVAESTSVEEEPARFEPMSAAVVEETAPDTHVVEAAVDEPSVVEAHVEEPAVVEAAANEPAEKPFDPDATQAIPEEFFTQSEPQLETTAELVGASIPESTVEAVVEPEPEPTAPAVEEAAMEASTVAPVIESPEPATFIPEPEPAVEGHSTPVEPPTPMVTSVATEPAILSVGPEPPSIEEEHEIQAPHVETPQIETPSLAAAAAAAGASVLGAAITEHFVRGTEPPSEPEGNDTAPGDQTQVFIASAVARVLDRMKPTLIEEIAREMSNRRKPRKDPEE